MNKSESILKISAALLKAQKEMTVAKKDAINTFFNNASYADLNAIRQAVMPALNANGITVLQTTTSDNILQTVLLHESGEFISSDMRIIPKDDRDPQKYGSAISYARRYSLQAMLCVGAEDDDAETVVRGPNPAPRQAVSKAKKAPSNNDF